MLTTSVPVVARSAALAVPHDQHLGSKTYRDIIWNGSRMREIAFGLTFACVSNGMRAREYKSAEFKILEAGRRPAIFRF